MEYSRAVEIAAPNSLYEKGDFVGKSVARVGVASSGGDFVCDDSEIFDRWSQAISSAHGLIASANSHFGDDEEAECAYWIVPVLVVPMGTLWVADYDSKGTLLGAPKVADEVEIYLDHSPWKVGQMFSYTISHLHFVTPEGMLKLVDRVLMNARFTSRILPAKTL